MPIESIAAGHALQSTQIHRAECAGGDSVTGLQVAGECLSGTWTWGHGLFLCLTDVSHCKLSA